MLKKQGTSRAFMVEDDMPKHRKVTRKNTSKTNEHGGQTGDAGGYYDDSLFLSAEAVIKDIDSFLSKEEKFPRVGCMVGYHDHAGTRGCHPIDKPHRSDVIQAMGGVDAYNRVHTSPPPKN
jgi:hypothetical protein|tara:strand:+ start:99 stop:461 length:363 start_codon:yes stop_codon:yes gene_type:complete